jgi:hypothetical protein
MTFQCCLHFCILFYLPVSGVGCESLIFGLGVKYATTALPRHKQLTAWISCVQRKDNILKASCLLVFLIKKTECLMPTTFSKLTFSIMTFSITTLCRMTISRMTFSITIDKIRNSTQLDMVQSVMLTVVYAESHK